MTVERQTVESFHQLYYGKVLDTWANTSWLGVPTEKLPSDLWVYQEIVSQLRPDFIIETGTRFGGSAVFLATVCDCMDHGAVITIDTEPLAESTQCRPQHPRISYLSGSSTSPDILQHVRDLTEGAECVMVILDSDHSMTHVSDELRIFADLVTEGSYLIVEDTNINGHPVAADYGPGPWEAVEVFLKTAPEFAPDYSREKFLLTFNPRGFLRKHTADSAQGRLLSAVAELNAQKHESEDLRGVIAELQEQLAQEAAARDAEMARVARELAARTVAISTREDEIAAREAEIEIRNDEERRLREQCAEAHRRIEQLTAEMNAVRRSTSWILTAPLRKLGALFDDPAK